MVPVIAGDGVPIGASSLATAVGAVELEPPSAVPVPVGTALGAATAEVGAALGAAPIGVAVGLPAPEVSQAVATTTNNNNSKDASTGDFLCG
jgi:hypothetical protein